MGRERRADEWGRERCLGRSDRRQIETAMDKFKGVDGMEMEKGKRKKGRKNSRAVREGAHSASRSVKLSQLRVSLSFSLSISFFFHPRWNPDYSILL